MKRNIRTTLVLVMALATLALGACTATGTRGGMSQSEQQSAWPRDAGYLINGD